MDVDDQAGGSDDQPLDAPKPGLTCLPQRAALLKSMLNFLKKAIQDPAFRSLPDSEIVCVCVCHIEGGGRGREGNKWKGGKW